MTSRTTARRALEVLRRPLRRIGATAALALCLTATAEAKTLRVPYGTPVVLQVEHPVSSGAVHVGERIPLVVADDVVVDGFVVVRQGAEGEGVVDSVTPAGSGGAGGAVAFTCEWVRAVDRSRLGITGSLSGNGGYRDSGNSAQPLNTGSEVASQTGMYGIGNALSRVTGIVQSVGIRPRGREAVVDTGRSIAATIRNPRGVVVTSLERAAGGAYSDPIK